MTTPTEKYVDNLMFALRMRNVPGEKIGQIAAEVEAHVAATGEDPADAFGKPREYAKTWARDAGNRPSWPERVRSVLGIAGAGVGGAILAVGGIRTVTGETVWGLHAVIALLAGMILMTSAALTLPKTDRVIDPRTGREAERVKRAGRRAMLVTGVAVLVWVVAAIAIVIVLG